MTETKDRILFCAGCEENALAFPHSRASSPDEALSLVGRAENACRPFKLCIMSLGGDFNVQAAIDIGREATEIFFIILSSGDYSCSSCDFAQHMALDRVMVVEGNTPSSTLEQIAGHFLARWDQTSKAQSLVKEVDLNRERLEAIYGIVEQIHGASALSDSISVVLTQMGRFLNAKTSSLMVVEGNNLRVIEAVGPNRERIVDRSFPLAESRIASHALRERKPVLVTDMQDDQRFGESLEEKRFRARSVISVPVFSASSPLAVINFGGDLESSTFNESDKEFVVTLARQLAAAMERDTLMSHLRQAVSGSIRALAGAIEAKDPYTRGHSDRVTHFCVLTALEMGISALEVKTIEHAALLHDVGKIGVPGDILRKKGRLDDEEFSLIKRHPELGLNIVRQIGAMDLTLPIIKSHHERVDGAGYPEGLSGDAIPLGARILAVADTFDAMTSNRPYRNGLPVDVALAELVRCANSQFDARVVEIFCRKAHRWAENYLADEEVPYAL